VSSIEVLAGDEVTVNVGYTHQVESSLDNVDVNTDVSATVQVEPHEYFLTSSGIYTGKLEGGYPSWLVDYISSTLSTSTDISVNPIVQSLDARVSDAELGINQNLVSIQTTNNSLSALETTLVSRLDGNDAAILNLDITKVTETEARDRSYSNCIKSNIFIIWW